MIYQYKEYRTTGSQGTFKTYQQAKDDKSEYICTYNDIHYRYASDDFEVSEQSELIEWKQADINEDVSAELVKHLENGSKQYIEALTLEGYRKYINDKLEVKSAAFEANLNKDMYFTSSLGFKSNGDRRTGTNLTNLVAMFDAMGAPTVDYRDYENQNHKLNKEQLQTLFAEQVMNGNAIYEQKWAKQQAIAAAKTKAELDKVDLNFVMQDFSADKKNKTLSNMLGL